MRTGIALLALVVSFQIFAGVIKHEILPGKFHANGSALITDTESPENADDILLTLDYSVVPRLFVPLPERLRKGKLEIEVPEKLLREEGYLELQSSKSMLFKGATFTYLGRVNVGQYYDSYKVQIDPKSKKFRVVLIYHPSIPGVGWYSTDITMLTDGLANNYKVQTRWVR